MNFLPSEILRGGDGVEMHYHFQVASHFERIESHFEQVELVLILALPRGMPGAQSLSTVPWNQESDYI